MVAFMVRELDTVKATKKRAYFCVAAINKWEKHVQVGKLPFRDRKNRNLRGEAKRMKKDMLKREMLLYIQETIRIPRKQLLVAFPDCSSVYAVRKTKKE